MYEDEVILRAALQQLQCERGLSKNAVDTHAWIDKGLQSRIVRNMLSFPYDTWSSIHALLHGTCNHVLTLYRRRSVAIELISLIYCSPLLVR